MAVSPLCFVPLRGDGLIVRWIEGLILVAATLVARGVTQSEELSKGPIDLPTKHTKHPKRRVFGFRVLSSDSWGNNSFGNAWLTPSRGTPDLRSCGWVDQLREP